VIRAGVILLAVLPLLAFRLAGDIAPDGLLAAVAGGQAGAICWIATPRLAHRRRLMLAAGAFGAVLVGLVLAGVPARVVALAAGGLCHTLAYLGLLGWFLTSLGPGREPAITAVARRVRRTMPERVVRYTRRVTIAWCGFFLAQLIASAVLLAAAPLWAWSAFVQTLNLPLVAAMLLAEFAWRQVVFRHEPRTSFRATVAALRHTTALPGNRP
jgi:uncharacterized membrane protein